MLSFVCLLALVCGSLAIAVPAGYTARQSINLTNTNNQVELQFDIQNTPFDFTFIPCFGAVSWSFNAPGKNETYPYTKDAALQQQGADRAQGNFTVFLRFWCVEGPYTGTDNCGVFNLFTTTTTDFETLQPVLGDDGKVKGKVLDKGKSGSITWKKSDNAADTYQVYYADSKTPPNGFHFATGCSVSLWMKNFTSDQGTIVDNGDGTVTATASGLTPKTPVSLTVVASRLNGVDAAYNTYVVNAGMTLKPIFAVVLAVLFLTQL